MLMFSNYIKESLKATQEHEELILLANKITNINLIDLDIIIRKKILNSIESVQSIKYKLLKGIPFKDIIEGV